MRAASQLFFFCQFLQVADRGFPETLNTEEILLEHSLDCLGAESLRIYRPLKICKGCTYRSLFSHRHAGE